MQNGDGDAAEKSAKTTVVEKTTVVKSSAKPTLLDAPTVDTDRRSPTPDDPKDKTPIGAKSAQVKAGKKTKETQPIVTEPLE